MRLSAALKHLVFADGLIAELGPGLAPPQTRHLRLIVARHVRQHGPAKKKRQSCSRQRCTRVCTADMSNMQHGKVPWLY